MYETLYEYLILHKELSVPGVGTFNLHQDSPVLDFPRRTITPASYYFSHHFPSAAPTASFFSWVGQKLNITEREAIIQFNELAFEMKKVIARGDCIHWKGVGKICKGTDEEVKFIAQGEILPEKPVHAEKVIREMAEHTVRVGEEVRNSAEMKKMFSVTTEKRSNWWYLPLVVTILSLVFIIWYFSRNGVSISSTGNSERVIPMESGPTYKMNSY